MSGPITASGLGTGCPDGRPHQSISDRLKMGGTVVYIFVDEPPCKHVPHPRKKRVSYATISSNHSYLGSPNYKICISRAFCDRMLNHTSYVTSFVSDILRLATYYICIHFLVHPHARGHTESLLWSIVLILFISLYFVFNVGALHCSDQPQYS